MRRRGATPSQIVVLVILMVAVFGLTGYAIYMMWQGASRELADIRANEDAPITTPPTPAPTTPALTTPTPAPTAPPEVDPIVPVIYQREAPAYNDLFFDAVILNARLINPETLHDMQGYNIGILDGRIAALTRRPLQGALVIDATGLVASPGFIDILSFMPNETGARFKITDGVTTNMQMHGGAINAHRDIGGLMANPPIINFGMSNFVAEIRRIMGYGSYTVMRSEASINQLVASVRQNILNGSIGISVIPEYTPGVQGAELLALAHLAAEMDVPMHWHIRYATPHGPHNSLVAIQEVIDLARETGAAMHINHINSTGATHVAEEAFAMIRAARGDGLMITACIYPYDYWATHIHSARFAPNWQTRFGITYADIQLPNSTERLTAATFAYLRANTRQLVFARGTMPDHEIRLAMQQDFMMIGSDTMLNAGLQGHPRGAGTFSRTIGHYARDEGVITLMEALAMMTIRPAQHLARASADIGRKGRLEIGADADITLFCFYTIIDTSSPENIASYSRGIYYVFVNGQLGLDRTGVLNARAGRAVRSHFISPAEGVAYVRRTLDYNGATANVQTFELFGLPFVDARAVAQQLGVTFVMEEGGGLTLGEARLTMGVTAFENHGQWSHLYHEPVIFRGSVYVVVYDLAVLLYGLVVAPV